MEFDIKELTIAVLVGAFAILGFEAILEFFFCGGPLDLFAMWMTKRAVPSGTNHRPGKKVEETLIIAAVFILVAFTLGVFAEDISQKNLYERPLYSFLKHLNFFDEVDDRASSLIKNFAEPSDLARDLAANNAFLISDTAKPGESSGPGRKVQEWIRNGSKCFPEPKIPTCPTRQDVENAAANLYYYAKNTVYLYPNAPGAAADLKAFEDRITFERSIAVIGIIYSVIAVPLFVILVFRRAFIIAAKYCRPMKSFRTWLQTKLSRLRVGIRRILSEDGQEQRESTKNDVARKPYVLHSKQFVLIVTLMTVSTLSLWAYGRETDAFNKRAFGYLSTMLFSENRKQQVWK